MFLCRTNKIYPQLSPNTPSYLELCYVTSASPRQGLLANMAEADHTPPWGSVYSYQLYYIKTCPGLSRQPD